MGSFSEAQAACLDAAAAWERQRHAFTFPADPDASLWHEEANIRLALAAEAEGEAGCCGLVSVPTSGRSVQKRTQMRAARLRALLQATETDKTRMRTARMRRQIGFSARAIEAGSYRPGFRSDYCAMVTMTYRDGDDWRPRHVSDFIKVLRRCLKRNGVACRYVWVAELQTRGTIHYHVALWLPQGFSIPKPDQAGWWVHGSTRVEAARKAVPYLMKYFSKGSTTASLPEGAHMYGSGGIEHSLRRARRWLGLPSFVKARSDISDDWSRAKFGGWNSPDGLWLPSEYERAFVGDRWACIKVADHGRPFEPDGPFSWYRSAVSP